MADLFAILYGGGTSVRKSIGAGGAEFDTACPY